MLVYVSLFGLLGLDVGEVRTELNLQAEGNFLDFKGTLAHLELGALVRLHELHHPDPLDRQWIFRRLRLSALAEHGVSLRLLLDGRIFAALGALGHLELLGRLLELGDGVGD